MNIRDIPVPSKIKELYEIEQNVSTKAGSFAVVYFGKRISDNMPVAIKVIDQKRNPNHPLIDREINVLRRCEHPNIIRFVDAVVENSVYAIVMERGSETLALNRQEKEHSMRGYEEIMRQLIRACYYLYENDIMHRDLKLQNIVRVGNAWKLVDFGFAIQGNINEAVVQSKLGNRYGRAPQILEGRVYNYKSDIWSLGVLCYKLVYNRFPFEGGTIGDVQRMRQNPFLNDMVPNGPRERNIQNFIGHCLIYHPQQRITWENIMRHPLMVDNLIDQMLEAEIRHTMSGEIVDPDTDILRDIFGDVHIVNQQQIKVLMKVLMTRKKIVVLENIFVDFVDCWLKKFLKDGQSTKYAQRNCLAPFLGHLASHIGKACCLIADKNKSATYQSKIFSGQDIAVLSTIPLQPNSLQYFSKIESRIISRLSRYDPTTKIAEVKELNQKQYRECLLVVESKIMMTNGLFNDNPKYQSDFQMLQRLLSELKQPNHGTLLDDINEHSQLEEFTCRYLFKSTILQAKKN